MHLKNKYLKINSFSLVACLFLASSCVSSHDSLQIPNSSENQVFSHKKENVEANIPDKPQDDYAYSAVISRWERDVTLYQDLQINFSGSAVLISPEMGEAYKKRAQQILGKNVKLDSNIVPEQDDILPVVITAYTPLFSFSEFEDTKIWNISLFYNHEWLHPSSLIYYRNKASLSPYFPVGSAWSKMYVAQFRTTHKRATQASPLPLPIVFSMHSGIAKADFYWRSSQIVDH